MVLLLLLTACSDPAQDTSPAEPPTESPKREEGKVGKKSESLLRAPVGDREISNSAGVLGSLRDDSALDSQLGQTGLNGDRMNGVGGLVGARGTTLGAYGSSGYGSGGGNFGSKGDGGITSFGGASSYDDGAALGRPAGSEGYRDEGVNPMTLTAEDPLSTFGTDVDTGSFTLARRLLLEEERLPSASGVRVEEFINYPDWDYPTPTDDSPVAVNLEAAPNPWMVGHHLVRVGLRAEDFHGDRPPANLVFLVDVSGSMEGPDRLPRARAALHTLVDGLGASDSVALVTYAGSTGVVLEPTPGSQKARIHSAIDGFSAGGGTAMGAGIDLAYGLAARAMTPGRENRVIVLSDGDANIGNTTPEALLAQISEYAGKGITLSTVGFGVGNYQDATMERFADKGDGSYYYIDSLEEAERIFTRDLAGTVQTVARDVKVQIAFEPAAVRAWRLVGYENRRVADQDFRNDKVDGGEIGAGQRVTVLYDVELNKAPEGPLATVSFRSKRPGPDRPAREWRTTLNAGAVRTSFAAASRDFRAAVGLAGFAEILRGSPYVGKLGFTDVERILEGARRSGRDDGRVDEMVRAAAELSAQEARARRNGDLDTEPPVILGALSAKEITAVIQRNSAQIRYCYQRELNKNPALAGRVVMKFVVAKDGTVSTAIAKPKPQSTLNNAAVESCIAGRFMRFQFPTPKGGGIVIVSYPFTFSPG